MESDMTLREKLKGKELKAFCFFSMAMLFVAAMAGMIQEGQGPLALIRGLWTIIISRDALITDYFELAGHGAAFLNGVLVMGMGMWLLCREKVKFTGLTMAAVFINVGYGFWGKNPVNILPILFGTSAYALVHGAQLSRYIYTGFFGTSLAPLVTELVYELPFDWRVNLLISIGIESESVMIWREGRPLWIAAGLYGYFLLTFLYGLYLCGGKWKGIGKVWKHPGRAVADFVLMEGEGNTLMNMALMGALCTTYICLIGGDLSGPVVGAILTAFGFSAFGAHVRNYLPVLAGVFLSTFLNRFSLTTPGVQLASVFAVGLAPIAGRFGIVPGILAGMLHTAIVMCTSQMYGGLNLYNNGFSAGWVAIIMVPVIESILMEYERRKRPAGDQKRV